MYIEREKTEKEKDYNKQRRKPAEFGRLSTLVYKALGNSAKLKLFRNPNKGLSFSVLPKFTQISTE